MRWLLLLLFCKNFRLCRFTELRTFSSHVIHLISSFVTY